MHFCLILSLKPFTLNVAIVISINNKNILKTSHQTQCHIQNPPLSYICKCKSLLSFFFGTNFTTFAANYMGKTIGLEASPFH